MFISNTVIFEVKVYDLTIISLGVVHLHLQVPKETDYLQLVT